jgi:hypothetical protein
MLNIILEVNKMSITIPHAGGLVSELEKRVNGVLSVSEPRVESRYDGQVKVSSIDVAVDGEKLGTVSVATYDRLGVTRVQYVDYKGRIPGFTNSCAGDDIAKDYVRMAASEFSRHKDPISEELDKPNDTPRKPLYRQDGHRSLKLSDYDVDDDMVRWRLVWDDLDDEASMGG